MQQPDAIESFESQFRGLSGTARWFAWLAVMVITAGIVVGVWFSLGSTDGVVVVICLLFLGLLVKSLRDVRFLDAQSQIASRQVRELAEAGDVPTFLQSSAPSVFRSHIASLHTVLLTDRELSQDNLIEIVHARLVSRSRMTELFANVLITLGLVGTIVGLIQAIGGLESVATAGDTDVGELSSGLLSTVSGLSTAFYTTLAGAIFGGIVLRVLSGVIDSAITGYVAHLSELTEVHVLPAMRRAAGGLERQGYYE